MINNTKNKGFTLIELLVVIAIIGLLASMSVVVINRYYKKSQNTAYLRQVRQLYNWMEIYYQENGHYIDSSGCGLNRCHIGQDDSHWPAGEPNPFPDGITSQPWMAIDIISHAPGWGYNHGEDGYRIWLVIWYVDDEEVRKANRLLNPLYGLDGDPEDISDVQNACWPSPPGLAGCSIWYFR